MTGDRFAIIIGCNNYPKDPKQFSTLRCAENDAEGVRDILVDKCNFNKENIKLFTSEPNYEILREINKRLRQVQSEDIVLIFFSGHGKLDIKNNLHLAVSNTEVVALEATSLPISSINDYIDKSSANRVVLILDCCYSGAVGHVFSKGSVDDAFQVAAAEGKGKYILTASTGIEVAQEKEGHKYSIFTKYFIDGLKTGKADLNNDGKITVDELYTYVHDEVKKDNFQEPKKFAFAQGDVVLVDQIRKHLMPESLSWEERGGGLVSEWVPKLGSHNRLKIAVLAMRKKEVEKLPGEVRIIIKDAYSDIPEKWKPFLDQSIENLIREVEKELDIRFIFISDHLINEKFEKLDGLSIQKKIANLKLKEENVLYIIDYLSLEIRWIADIVREIEKFSNIGCLMPINVKYPTHLQNRMSELRDNNLIYISHDRKESNVVEEAPTIEDFKKRLRSIALDLVRRNIVEKRKEPVREDIVKDISNLLSQDSIRLEKIPKIRREGVDKK